MAEERVDNQSLDPAAAGAGPAAARRTAPPRRAARLRRPIALVGLMGAGKSAIGRRLADAIGAAFRDSDDEIERAAGMSIPEIFESYGEPQFRDGERRVIARLLGGPPLVLATGGGAFIDDASRALMRDKAYVIWLRADLDTLVERCSRRADRPLLRQGDPRAVLSALMVDRHPIYAQAHEVIDSVNGPHEMVVAEALRRLEAAGVVAPSA